MSALIDTFGELPAITRPMPTMPLNLPRWGVEAATDDGQRWTAWGAARAGAHQLMTRRQQIALGVAVALALCLGIAALHLLLLMAIAVCTFTYLLAGIYKGALLFRAEHASTVTAPDLSAVPEDHLPMYSVLVPLYHEGRVASSLIEQLTRLDYPTNRLDILLLAEADDDETRAALRALALPSHMRVILVPPGLPRTKPRALNVGLSIARGDFLVVYDAEDRPEPDQLRKAVATFASVPRRVVCLQARLNFYNRHQSLLTHLFSVDYATWYDMLLPGLVGGRALVPLGGTSNHFRLEALRRLGGWDPYNVTEDADLGARISRAHLEVRMLDSTTWEEAVAHAPQWIRQRSRWVKGYMQTYLVHMRDPRKLLRDLGPRAFLDFQMMVGGTTFILLINPLMWLLTIFYFLVKGSPAGASIEALFPPALYYPALLCLLANFVFFYSQLYICVRLGYDDLARYALLGPLYWLLMSAGAWAGLVSLLRDPYYWAKTEHGVSLAPRTASTFTSRDHQLSGGPRTYTSANSIHVDAHIRGRALAHLTSSVATRTGVMSAPLGTARVATESVMSLTRPVVPLGLSVILPAHNEQAIIEQTVRSVRDTLSSWDFDFEILVVDDGSTDRTATLVKALARADPRVCVISHETNQGYGAALVTGFEAARKDLVFFMDSDGQFDINDLARLLPRLRAYDVVLGYRIHRRDHWLRKLNAFGWKLLVWFFLGVRVRDLDCAFKVLPGAFFRQHRLQCRGALINAELLYKLQRSGYTWTEVGVRHLERTAGRATGAKISVIARALKELVLFAWTWRLSPARPSMDAERHSNALS